MRWRAFYTGHDLSHFPPFPVSFSFSFSFFSFVRPPLLVQWLGCAIGSQAGRRRERGGLRGAAISPRIGCSTLNIRDLNQTKHSCGSVQESWGNPAWRRSAGLGTGLGVATVKYATLGRSRSTSSNTTQQRQRREYTYIDLPETRIRAISQLLGPERAAPATPRARPQA